MPHLQRLTPGHAPALLTFEQDNRAYFAASIPDRGDDYFTDFTARHRALLDEQDQGLCHFHVLTDDSGTVLGRVNLVDVDGASAELGYRIAQKAAGQGLATAAVREICALAVTRYGLTTLRAVTTTDNIASQTVLTRTGFITTGPTLAGGRPGHAYTLDLTRL